MPTTITTTAFDKENDISTDLDDLVNSAAANNFHFEDTSKTEITTEDNISFDFNKIEFSGMVQDNDIKSNITTTTITTYDEIDLSTNSSDFSTSGLVDFFSAVPSSEHASEEMKTINEHKSKNIEKGKIMNRVETEELSTNKKKLEWKCYFCFLFNSDDLMFCRLCQKPRSMYKLNEVKGLKKDKEKIIE